MVFVVIMVGAPLGVAADQAEKTESDKAFIESQKREGIVREIRALSYWTREVDKSIRKLIEQNDLLIKLDMARFEQNKIIVLFLRISGLMIFGILITLVLYGLIFWRKYSKYLKPTGLFEK